MLTAKASKIMPIDLTAGYNPVRFPVIDNQTTYNLYEFEGAMIPTPGFKNLFQISSSEQGRGLFYSDIFSQTIAVIGADVYLITPLSHSLIGSLKTTLGDVFFSENAILSSFDSKTGNPGGQVVISDGDNIYILRSTGELIIAKNDQGDDLTFRPGMLAFQDDFFFTIDIDSNRLYASQLNNGAVWPVLSFTTIDSIARGVIAFERTVFVFGKDLTQVFQDAAQFPFPYQKDITRAYEYGCLSPATIAVSSGIFVWLASTRATTPLILASQGGNPEAISTPGIDNVLSNLKRPQDSEGFIYEQDGHIFYQINFLNDNISLLYDFYTKKWFVVSSANQKTNHPIRKTVLDEQTNKFLAITNTDGNIYEFGVNFFTNDGEIVKRTIIGKNIVFNERPMICKELDVQIQQGENETTSKVCLLISKDRGRTFGATQIYELGNIGFRINLLRFRKLGASRWWTFKLDFLSAEAMVVLKAEGFFG